MSAAVERLGFRVSVRLAAPGGGGAAARRAVDRFRPRRGADRAGRVLAAKTVVPADYSARLVDALNAPPVANEPLHRAAERAPSVVDRTP